MREHVKTSKIAAIQAKTISRADVKPVDLGAEQTQLVTHGLHLLDLGARELSWHANNF
jgi:hypothetical protein